MLAEEYPRNHHKDQICTLKVEYKEDISVNVSLKGWDLMNWKIFSGGTYWGEGRNIKQKRPIDVKHHDR